MVAWPPSRTLGVRSGAFARRAPHGLTARLGRAPTHDPSTRMSDMSANSSRVPRILSDGDRQEPHQ
jgi:hypothetical protein